MNVAAGMTVVAIVSISGGFGFRFGFSLTLVDAAVGVGGVTVTGISVVAVVSGTITVISQTVISVSTAVVAIVSIGGGFSLRFGFGFTLVDLRDTVGGGGGIYVLERGSSGDGIIVGSISIGKGSIGSKELRFGISFGLTLVVSVSVSAVGVSSVVSTITVVSTVIGIISLFACQLIR